jgi:hypothetical protein
VAPQVPALPKVEFRTSPTKAPVFPRVSYKITADLTNQTTTLELERGNSEFGNNWVTYRVSDLNPADVVMNATYHYVVARPEKRIEVRANMVTESDAAVFRQVVQVAVTIDGHTHFHKSWTTSVPRILN